MAIISDDLNVGSVILSTENFKKDIKDRDGIEFVCDMNYDYNDNIIIDTFVYKYDKNDDSENPNLIFQRKNKITYNRLLLDYVHVDDFNPLVLLNDKIDVEELILNNYSLN